MKSIKKPWGRECVWAKTDRYAAKLILIEPGESLSLQYHVYKDESILVFKGPIDVETKSGLRHCEDGDVLNIPHGVVHRISNPGSKRVVLFEVSTPELEDVVRLKDNYGRV